MRKLRDLLRLKYEPGLSHRAIARACSIRVSTVSVHLQRAVAAGLRWPLASTALSVHMLVEASRKRRDVERGPVDA